MKVKFVECGFPAATGAIRFMTSSSSGSFESMLKGTRSSSTNSVFGTSAIGYACPPTGDYIKPGQCYAKLETLRPLYERKLLKRCR
jgi:hypothetical protein